MFIAILIAWNLPVVREVIAGLKVSFASSALLTIASDGRNPRAVSSRRRSTVWWISRLDLYRPE